MSPDPDLVNAIEDVARSIASIAAALDWIAPLLFIGLMFNGCMR